MTTLKQITIKSPMTERYFATITLAQISNLTYVVLIMTTYKGEDREYSSTYHDYQIALNEYIKEVGNYAEHTAMMTL